MQPHQQTYRLLIIVWGILIFWNLFIVAGLVMAGAWTHVPKIMWSSLLLWFVVSIVGSILIGLTIKGLPLIKDFGTKSVITLIMVIASTTPTLPSLFHKEIQSYINSWEAMHCVQIGLTQTTNPWPIVKCDNGDTLEKPTDLNDTRRFWYLDGNKSTHYPYSFFY